MLVDLLPRETTGTSCCLLVGLNYSLVIFGTTNTTDLTAVIVDVVVTAIRLGISGAVVGAVLGKIAP